MFTFVSRRGRRTVGVSTVVGFAGILLLNRASSVIWGLRISSSKKETPRSNFTSGASSTLGRRRLLSFGGRLPKQPPLTKA